MARRWVRDADANVTLMFAPVALSKTDASSPDRVCRDHDDQRDSRRVRHQAPKSSPVTVTERASRPPEHSVWEHCSGPAFALPSELNMDNTKEEGVHDRYIQWTIYAVSALFALTIIGAAWS